MKISIVRLIQKSLVKAEFYVGVIDGKRGPKTKYTINEALTQQPNKLPDHWAKWSDKRQVIAYLQLLCHEKGIEAGQVDGFNGPTTENAAEQLFALVSFWIYSPQVW